MSRNAFAQCEREYNERIEQREHAAMERKAGADVWEFAPTICLTGHPVYHPNEQTLFDGPLDATEWLPAGSTREIPAEPGKFYAPRLITDRMVLRP